MTTHIPTMSEIIDQLMLASEHTNDQDEHDALIAMLRIAEDYAARQARIVAATERVIVHIATTEKEAS